MRRLALVAAAAAGLVGIAYGASALDRYGKLPPPTPTHVAAVFIDGFNQGDLRETCSMVQPSVLKRDWKNMPGCENYMVGFLGQTASMFGYSLGGYRIIPHSVKEWREGDVRVASVAVTYAPIGGKPLHVRLIETRVGWRVAGFR